MTSDKKGIPGWAIALIIVGALVPLMGIMSAVGIYGVRRYIINAKAAEGRANVAILAEGVVRCASSSGSLPRTSAAVPSSLADVSGKKYFASPGEWADPALSCAGFAMKDPQYFQYQWVLLGPLHGEARAQADLDGDGVSELSFSAPVNCGGGSCSLGALVEVGTGAPTTRAKRVTRTPGSRHSKPGDAPPVAALVLGGVYTVVSMVAGIWSIVLAFQESATWGLLSLFVPCANLVFVIKFWHRAKTPFLIQVGAGVLLVAGLALVMFEESKAAKYVAPSTVDSAATTAAPAGPPKVTGNAVDLSTVMGRARALADAWQSEAALCGINATISDGLVQTGEGATATLVFGPSPFGAAGARSGRFVVTYDSTGMHSSTSAEPAGRALIEPMCAPETAYRRATGSNGAPVTLRYALDTHGANAVWLIQEGGSAPAVAFDNQHCAPASP